MKRPFEDTHDFNAKTGLWEPKLLNYTDFMGYRMQDAEAVVFLPSDIASLAMWVNFDDLGSRTLNGDDISQQTDLKNGNDCVQITAIEQPLFVASGINGLGSSEHDGVEEYFNVIDDTINLLTAAEMFIIFVLVADPPAAAAQSGSFHFTGDLESTHLPWVTGQIFDSFGTTVRKTTVDPTPAMTTARCYNVVSTSSEWTSELDGAQLFTTGTNTVGFDNAEGPKLGQSAGAQHDFDGQLAEWFVFGEKLSLGNKALMETYINSQRGITFA